MTTPTWLGPVRQTAFVVDDVEAAALEWATTHGVGPWLLYSVDIPGTSYRGDVQPLRARMGLAQSGGQQIELIKHDPAVPSIYQEFVDAGGTGLHHVCYWAELEPAKEHFASTGADVVQEGVTANGNGFLYMSGSCGVPYIEIVKPEGAMARLFDHVASMARDWDGTDPVRTR